MSKYRIVVEITDPEITDPIWMLQMKLEGIAGVHNTGISVDSIQEVSGNIWEEIVNESRTLQNINGTSIWEAVVLEDIKAVLQKHGVIE